jgi:hypothetical protein
MLFECGKQKQPKPNSEKAKKRPEKTKKDEVDGHAAHLANDGMSIIMSTTAHGTLDSLSTMLEPHCRQAINNDLMVLTINDSHQVDDPNALVAKSKAACAAATNAEVNNGTYTYDAFTSTITHHLHNLSFHAMQEINITVYNEIVGLYVQHSDDVYSNGVPNISNVLPFDQVLRLQATSHAIVRMMQNTRVDCLLCVLFDSGADKMMMKRSVLPLGVNPSLGRKRQVTGVTTSALLDKEVLIEDMILPEFSATTHISGPICAIIVENVESSYDFILGMDLIQTLRIDIHNLSKTIVWGNLQVPFTPHDYFSSNLFQTVLQDHMVSLFDEHNAMKSCLDINPKLLKVCCTNNMTHTMWPNNTLVYLTEAGINATISSFLEAVNWDAFPINKFTLNYKKTLNHSGVVHTQYPNIMSKSSKTGFNVSVTLECLKDVVHPNGYRLHLSLRKRTAESDGFPTFRNLTSLLNAKSTICQRSKTYCHNVPVTHFLLS